MVKRFPHILKITYNPEPLEATQDENGNWVVPEQPEKEEIELDCRFEPNVRQNYVTNEADGQRVIFNFVLYLDKNSIKVEAMQEVELLGESNELVYKGRSIRFHKGQLHNRVWI